MEESGGPAASNKCTAEEYLRQCNIQGIMSDALTALSQQRPTHPLAFLANYFTEMADEPSILLRTYRSIMLAYRSQIHRTKPDRFTDLLASTYTELSTTNSTPWVTHGETCALVEALCIDLPPAHLRLIKAVLKDEGRARDADRVPFSDYAVYIRAAVGYRDLYLDLKGCMVALGFDAEACVEGNVLLRHVESIVAARAQTAAEDKMGLKTDMASISTETAARLRAALDQLQPSNRSTSGSFNLIQLGRAAFRIMTSAGGRVEAD